MSRRFRPSIGALVVVALTGWLSATAAPAQQVAARGPQTANDGAITADDSVEVTDLEVEESRAIEATASADAATKTPGKLKTATQKVVKDPALQFTDPRTYRMRVSLRVEAPGGKLENVSAITPIPMDWPEQEVRLLSEKVSPGGKVTQQVFPGQRAMLKLQVGSIPAGGSASVERTYEITRYRMQFLIPGEELSFTRQVPVDIRDQLTGPAPGLETKNAKIMALTEQLKRDSAGKGAWETVHSFWQWTRDNIKFERGDFRGAAFAIENQCGDCEEMSALFISMCRIANIGARTVWVDGTDKGHNYPEFFLVDKKGQGHWIPAQVVGPAWFGEMAEYRPIFQKGDRFFDPFKKEHVRYAPHTLRVGNGVAGVLKPLTEILADADINGPSYNSTK